MKKRNLAIGIGSALGAAVAVKMLTRQPSVETKNFAKVIHHPDHSNFIEVDGATIHYQEFGNPADPKLLLIHGYTASTYVWKSVAPEFAERGYHVIAPDLLGFGYSDKPASFEYSIQAQARMVMRLMNVLGIGQASIVGSSYGGAVASVLTLDYPERVEKLVLVGAVINDRPMQQPIMRLAGLPLVGEIMTPFLLDSRLFMRHRMKNTFAPENRDLVTKDRIESVRRPLNAADAHRAVLKSARNWDADRIEQDAHLIDQPTLLLWGEDDLVIPVGNGHKMHDKVLNSRFVVFKNCGHLPMEEMPEQFVSVIDDFCSDPKGRLLAKSDDEMQVEN